MNAIDAVRTAIVATVGVVAFLLPAGHASSADPAVGSDVQVDAESFRCIRKMTSVRHFYVDNLQGNLEATLAAANSATGAVYPPGSVIQLVPGEAMVKRSKGFNTATRDWEFFELAVSKEGTEIKKRRIHRCRQSLRWQLLWVPRRCAPRVGSRLRRQPRLRADPPHSRHERSAAASGSSLRECSGQRRGCRGAPKTQRAIEAALKVQ